MSDVSSEEHNSIPDENYIITYPEDFSEHDLSDVGNNGARIESETNGVEEIEEDCEEVVNGVWSPTPQRRNLRLDLSSIRDQTERTNLPKSNQNLSSFSSATDNEKQDPSPAIWQPFGEPAGSAQYRSIKIESSAKHTQESSVTSPTAKKTEEPPEAKNDDLTPSEAIRSEITTTNSTVVNETTDSTTNSSASSIRSVRTSNFPVSQSPTVTLLQKAREGQIPRGAIYINDRSENKGPLLPKNAVLIDQKVTVEGDKVHTDSYYAVPASIATGESSTQVINAPSKYDGIGPTEYGIPVGLRTGVKDEYASDWYKTMYRSLHKGPADSRGHVQAVHLGGYMSEPEYERRSATLDSRRRVQHSTQTEHRPRKTEKSTVAREISPPKPPESQKSMPEEYVFEVSPGKSKEEPYRNQPRSIADYEPGHSSLADKEFQKFWDDFWESLDDLHEYFRLSPRPPQQSTERKWPNAILCDGYESDSTLIHKSVRPVPQPDPEQQKAWYKEIQKGGEIPFTGLRKLAPERPKVFDQSSLSSTSAYVNSLEHIYSYHPLTDQTYYSNNTEYYSDNFLPQFIHPTSENNTFYPLIPQPPKRFSSWRLEFLSPYRESTRKYKTMSKQLKSSDDEYRPIKIFLSPNTLDTSCESDSTMSRIQGYHSTGVKLQGLRKTKKTVLNYSFSSDNTDLFAHNASTGARASETEHSFPDECMTHKSREVTLRFPPNNSTCRTDCFQHPLTFFRRSVNNVKKIAVCADDPTTKTNSAQPDVNQISINSNNTNITLEPNVNASSIKKRRKTLFRSAKFNESGLPEMRFLCDGRHSNHPNRKVCKVAFPKRNRRSIPKCCHSTNFVDSLSSPLSNEGTTKRRDLRNSLSSTTARSLIIQSDTFRWKLNDLHSATKIDISGKTLSGLFRNNFHLDGLYRNKNRSTENAKIFNVVDIKKYLSSKILDSLKENRFFPLWKPKSAPWISDNSFKKTCNFQSWKSNLFSKSEKILNSGIYHAYIATVLHSVHRSHSFVRLKRFYQELENSQTESSNVSTSTPCRNNEIDWSLRMKHSSVEDLRQVFLNVNNKTSKHKSMHSSAILYQKHWCNISVSRLVEKYNKIQLFSRDSARNREQIEGNLTSNTMWKRLESNRWKLEEPDEFKSKNCENFSTCNSDTSKEILEKQTFKFRCNKTNFLFDEFNSVSNSHKGLTSSESDVSNYVYEKNCSKEQVHDTDEKALFQNDKHISRSVLSMVKYFEEKSGPLQRTKSVHSRETLRVSPSVCKQHRPYRSRPVGLDSVTSFNRPSFPKNVHKAPNQNFQSLCNKCGPGNRKKNFSYMDLREVEKTDKQLDCFLPGYVPERTVSFLDLRGISSRTSWPLMPRNVEQRSSSAAINSSISAHHYFRNEVDSIDNVSDASNTRRISTYPLISKQIQMEIPSKTLQDSGESRTLVDGFPTAVTIVQEQNGCACFSKASNSRFNFLSTNENHSRSKDETSDDSEIVSRKWNPVYSSIFAHAKTLTSDSDDFSLKSEGRCDMNKVPYLTSACSESQLSCSPMLSADERSVKPNAMHSSGRLKNYAAFRNIRMSSGARIQKLIAKFEIQKSDRRKFCEQRKSYLYGDHLQNENHNRNNKLIPRKLPNAVSLGGKTCEPSVFDKPAPTVPTTLNQHVDCPPCHRSKTGTRNCFRHDNNNASDQRSAMSTSSRNQARIATSSLIPTLYKNVRSDMEKANFSGGLIITL